LAPADGSLAASPGNIFLFTCALDTSYTLPVDVKILALIPHAHYLAKEMATAH
jgi:hypothetical protein